MRAQPSVNYLNQRVTFRIPREQPFLNPRKKDKVLPTKMWPGEKLLTRPQRNESGLTGSCGVYFLFLQYVTALRKMSCE